MRRRNEHNLFEQIYGKRAENLHTEQIGLLFTEEIAGALLFFNSPTQAV